MLGSDVIYNEEAVDDLLATLNQLSGKHTTILLAGELRNGKASLSRSLFHFGMGSSDCVSRPHPGDPSAAPRPERKRARNVKLSGPEWACVSCNERPKSE